MRTADSARDPEQLAEAGLAWLLSSARQGGDGKLHWTTRPSDEEPNPVLYSGTSGIAVALLEAYRHFGDDRYGTAALRAARSIAAVVPDWELHGLYLGLSGMAFALHAVGEQLDDPASTAAARRALDRVRAGFDGTRWGRYLELLSGNAGVALGALAVGDRELALLAVEPFLRTAEPTAHGVQWEQRQGTASRLHHVSHGTLGIVAALASVGRAEGRADLVELALAGAADVVARDEAGPWGFLVPHSDPQASPERIERYSFGWCHGPAGDAQVFRLLRDVDPGGEWSALVDRCWYTVTRSGLPRRLHPGFWDNSGRCCGTAGVLALAGDRMAEDGDGAPRFAAALVADLSRRASVDDAGARWSNVEHRRSPSLLEPEYGWAMGNAGIVRELLRFVRVSRGDGTGYSVAWPDQPSATVET
ncbi:lanthionine synthetase LanC family protein [Streptacidiphilus fuscans]|uniref:Lanthionine synthetase C family protein n=1 Tax=Streptacidiphilus fuscans TaxID=2789292 RepID=A0A931FFR9_9ACTN|nr:lanthionine synthetase LanC family protein [Streptacidiphilus fuscans]MBF9070161.1 lanthionine synthetase C family protein [Streptacidiphilus fuscans]